MHQLSIDIGTRLSRSRYDDLDSIESTQLVRNIRITVQQQPRARRQLANDANTARLLEATGYLTVAVALITRRIAEVGTLARAAELERQICAHRHEPRLAGIAD